ncbi:hypothetical protein OG302_39895 [Streptomyces sp. NBC_01283]|uniref:hypothetical protein n=1 Tax=Streptomyces sp. NBC_01283 TaxID=2903812 RepID=UPI00352FEE43|nr:hypothetical protein OG302_39895 [Streptomyces sp. NBC_01283]
MKKRSVLAVVTFAAGAVIAAISPPPGADTADTREPAHATGALDVIDDAGQWTGDAPQTPGAGVGVVAPDISSTQRL